MSSTIQPPKIIVKTLVTSITGLLEGGQYKEWTTDDWLDAFIKNKVEELNASA